MIVSCDYCGRRLDDWHEPCPSAPLDYAGHHRVSLDPPRESGYDLVIRKRPVAGG